MVCAPLTKSEFFECAFGPLSSHPLSLILPPPLFDLQALFTVPPLLPSSPPPPSPLLWLSENSDLGWECPNDPWPQYFCKSIAIQMGAVSWYKLVVYTLLFAKRRAYFCKSIAIEMGGVSWYFSKVSGSGVDLTQVSAEIRTKKFKFMLFFFPEPFPHTQKDHSR